MLSQRNPFSAVLVEELEVGSAEINDKRKKVIWLVSFLSERLEGYDRGVFTYGAGWHELSNNDGYRWRMYSSGGVLLRLIFIELTHFGKSIFVYNARDSKVERFEHEKVMAVSDHRQELLDGVNEKFPNLSRRLEPFIEAAKYAKSN